ncbi:MAG: hypothetical protein NVS3B14_10750 [Ktedonobacteraceae bacterium]
MPPVVQFDGIWLRMQTQTDTIKGDKRQRKRKKRVERKWCRWGEQSSMGAIRARLWERGLRPDTGLQAVIRDGCGKLGEAIAWVLGSTVLEQRCIFHTLRNEAD